MSVGSLGGIITSAAGAPISQTAGGETERTKDSLNQGRQVDAKQKAESAAGIGQTEQDQQSSERDADGRRPWEVHEKTKKEAAEAAAADTAIRHGRDATGQSGTKLDLTG